MAFKPRQSQSPQAKPSHDARSGKIARLQLLAGCRYEFPNGTIGKLEQSGIYVKGIGTMLYADMALEQLEEITRQNEAFICHEDADPVTEDWARKDIEQRIKDKEDPYRIMVAKALFRKCFKKPFDKNSPGLADLVFKKTPPKAEVVWEEVAPQALPEPPLPPEFNDEPPF